MGSVTCNERTQLRGFRKFWIAKTEIFFNPKFFKFDPDNYRDVNQYYSYGILAGKIRTHRL